MNILLKEAIRRYGNGVAPIRRSSNLKSKPVVKTGGSHIASHKLDTDIPQTQRGVRYLVNQLIKSHISKMNPTK